MKRILIVLLLAVFTFAATVPAYASDWDKAGIALTGIEGLRIITGGKVDLIGSMFGMKNKEKSWRKESKHFLKKNKRKHKHKHKRIAKSYDCTHSVWVPHYEWAREYIPEQRRHNSKYGKIIVEGHYIQYKVERGGHWETKYYCG